MRVTHRPSLFPAPRAENLAQDADSGRDVLFDNAKFLAVVLVACGHAWAPLRADSRTIDAVYLLCSAFRMPAMILIAGYLSRHHTGSPRQIRNMVRGLVVPYLFFETAYTVFSRRTGSPGHLLTLFDPWYLMWFLPALFIWRLTVPVWKTVRHPLAVALVIACLATLAPELGTALDLQRVLQFLPFFVLGLHLRRSHFALLDDRRTRRAAPYAAIGALAVAYGAAPHVQATWFRRESSAAEQGLPPWSGPVMTLALFVCALLLVACFLACVPHRRVWFSPLGTRTAYAYLLHGFIALGAKRWGWYEHAWIHTPTGFATVTAIAVTVATLLCTAPVRQGFHWAVEPELGWMFPLANAAKTK
ncbi:acyltransferase family protein [Streptomyces sp. NPDC101733]|uniref:acyltransferase family protein n=1 Tax=unclassified Streptomyces TaxID=2593676 RepID=UPI0038098866